MTRFVDITVEPLSEASFAPFGAVIGAGEAGPVLSVATMETWKVPFEVEDAAEVIFCRFHRQEPVFSMLERHLAVTQAFLPLAGRRSIMVVAPPTDESDRNAGPEPGAVRAFLLAGDEGVVLHRGTWHALRRFPVDDPHADFVMLTSRGTQAEIERQAADGTTPALTHEIDYAKARGVTFRIVGMPGSKR
jgi:ureidoglycolate lyase